MGEVGEQRADEESIALSFAAETRKPEGRYFTPAPLVDFTFECALPLVPRHRPLAIVDPACGAGAFLCAAQRFFPRARLFGLELSDAVASRCEERFPRATVIAGDALRGDLLRLLERIPSGAFELWVGNPPYNGTSSVLKDADAYRALRGLLPRGFSLPAGTSLRDDFAFFLLLAATRLRQCDGALAFITSATLLDAYLYSELRRILLETLSLREVVDLGRGAFSGTRVRTCVTVWSSNRGDPAPSHFRQRNAPPRAAFEPSQLCAPTPFKPCAPDWALRAIRPEAEELDQSWRRDGENLTALVPLSFPGLKTRFDELLVDRDPGKLLDRLADFLASPMHSLPTFARAHGIPDRCLVKLQLLKLSVQRRPFCLDASKVRPFFRYAGARHRGVIPPSARAYCYLDRRLIPRGDHRLRGAYDPHACPAKLIFNVRELPLCAALLEEEGCVHDHRHTRFAPLFAPAQMLDRGGGFIRSRESLGPIAPNLSAAGRALAQRWGGPLNVFRALVDFINSGEVQETWAPAYGTARELPVPIHRWSAQRAQMYPNRRRKSHSVPRSATSATK